MKENSNVDFDCCLFFTLSSLTRQITEMAEKEFRQIGLGPSYAYLVLLVAKNPGLTQKELSQRMNLKSSTLTRLFDKLVNKGIIEKIQDGREVNIYVTPEGEVASKNITIALNALHKKYELALGESFSTNFISDVNKAIKMVIRDVE
ncbi:MAG: MarR family transcriptional regulator [Marinifilaceae bacterium]|jgi:DNA-binding MarR family transcriptional regulator|nr:MarR family transcriptional regulator [Marinifilaceae bacterium]